MELKKAMSLTGMFLRGGDGYSMNADLLDEAIRTIRAKAKESRPTVRAKRPHYKVTSGNGEPLCAMACESDLVGRARS
jgi:hypothetical protein